MKSHEDEVRAEYVTKPSDLIESRLNIPTIKYFWQVSPINRSKEDNVPKFLRSIKIFDTFTDYELKKFSHFLHERNFLDNELIIEEGSTGFGFYIIYSGHVEIFTKRNRLVEGQSKLCQQMIVDLTKYEYFGELSLLEDQNKRNASAVSRGVSNLLAIYKPDLEELIERYPIIGAKFLQGVSFIVSQRFNRIALEVRTLKEKIVELESKIANPEV